MQAHYIRVHVSVYVYMYVHVCTCICYSVGRGFVESVMALSGIGMTSGATAALCESENSNGCASVMFHSTFQEYPQCAQHTP